MKNALKIIFKYSRDLSIVVAGIALTFGISNWAGKRSERQETERYLDAIKSELIDNLAVVEEQFDFHNRTGLFAKYLASTKPENLLNDSIAKYEDIKRNAIYMIHKTSAFEMFKSSGGMRLIKDKDLLRSIIDSYTSLEMARSTGDEYLATKSEVVYEALLENLEFDEDYSYDLRRPEYKKVLNFFTIYTASEGIFRYSKHQIEETLEMIDSADL